MAEIYLDDDTVAKAAEQILVAAKGARDRGGRMTYVRVEMRLAVPVLLAAVAELTNSECKLLPGSFYEKDVQYAARAG
jgi:hypothetical protein